ncbi:acetyl-CoA carboxylase biotin carboxyl carrier protein subunit [Shewanella surugensis]
MSLSCEQVNSGEVKKLVISQPILNCTDPQTITQKIPQKIFQVTSLAQGQDSHTLNIANDNNDNGNNKIDPSEQLAIITLSNNKIRYLYQGVIKTRHFVFDQNPASASLWLSNIAGNLQFFDRSLTSTKVTEAGSEQVTASMDGVVVDVLVKEGDPVACGDVIAIIDAMKMEHMLKSSIDGHVEKVLTTTGNQVKAQQLLVQLKQFT